MMASRGESQTETDRTSESSKLSVEKSPSQFTLNVNILRFRAVAIPVAMAGFFVGVTLPFAEDGIQVGFFRSIDLDETARKDLQYWTIIFLIYAAKMGVYFESRRRYLMMGAIGVVGYLMNTGFNSLNLQVVPGRVHPRIASADLAVENVQDHAQDVDANGFLTTTWDTKFREDTPGNSVLNIIFRNLFISMEDVPTWCDSIDDYLVPFKEVFASYGFPSRSWQQRVLSKALEPTGVLSMPMNAAASDLPPDEELPMSVGNATNLAAYAMVVSNGFLGWWGWLDDTSIAWVLSSDVANSTRQPFAMADYLNLTTWSSTNATFVSDVHEVIVDYFKKAENASTTDELAKLEFTHVDLSDTVVFDSLTIEIPTQKFGKQEDNSSSSNPYFKELAEYTCNTQACLVNDVYEFTKRSQDKPYLETTIHPRVQAIAICLNDDGVEELTVDFKHEFLQACKQRSNTSMIIISVGKRVEGDSLANTTRTDLDRPIPNDLINARIVYSLTVGRLSWIRENLSEAYGADCISDEGCYGVRFPLEQGDDGNASDTLLVRDTSIPMDLLSPIDMLFGTKWKVLAATLEVGTLTNEFRPAQIILPRKFKTRDSSLTTFMLSEDASCERMVDKYLNHIEKNHLYIEHTLQPAYTAGLYFILQNAVVLKQINVSDIPLATSLEFSGNILDMHIRASIPTTSMTFAFFGCFIMVLGGVAIAFLSKHAEAALLKRNTATIAAEALDNPEKYPPFMLRLQLRDCSTGKAADVEYNSLCVDSVVLVSNQDKTQQFAIGTRRA
ncbi:hypothetical protein PF008_g27552 [Phytophthora fragariae]|uniref:Uncharacterized protein n=1 Tax=Phytophthora fragariae TaxID=53985 RepID=A0A6G0QDZ3_9STRA|nr:hypothetical protein PF008_g27552 [Phytophthora fragariae]